MSKEHLYFKQNVQVEPLSDNWYAWPHLIPPATNARNITERHFKIMDSYVNAPQVHAAAVKNPQMRGGPFIDYGGKHVDEIRALRNETRANRSEMVEMSAALGRLDALMRDHARGFSLQPLYEKVPEELRGYVELFYDLNNQASYRLLEPLLYRSRFYDERAQSVALSLTTGDDRPFVLSTPRLSQMPGVMTLRWPFADPRLDVLFRLKTEPQPLSWIQSQLGLTGAEAEAFQEFLTPEPPPPYQRYEGPGVRWRYFGHACILIETRDVSIVVDPVLSYTYESDISRYTYADLPPVIDLVLITHNHQDHILLETLLQIRHKTKHVIVPENGCGQLQDPSLRLILNQIGFDNVTSIRELDEVKFKGGSIMGLPFFGEHADLAVHTKMSYLVRLGTDSILLAADSCNLEPSLYDHLRKVTGDVDVLFLGMECDGAPLTWLYGPLLTQRIERGMDESRRLSGSDYRQAIAIVERFNCRDVYVYAMGQEPWLNYIMSIKYTSESRPIVESDRLIAECRSRGLRSERLFGEREILLDGNRHAFAAGMPATGAA